MMAKFLILLIFFSKFTVSAKPLSEQEVFAQDISEENEDDNKAHQQKEEFLRSVRNLGSTFKFHGFTKKGEVKRSSSAPAAIKRKSSALAAITYSKEIITNIKTKFQRTVASKKSFTSAKLKWQQLKLRGKIQKTKSTKNVLNNSNSEKENKAKRKIKKKVRFENLENEKNPKEENEAMKEEGQNAIDGKRGGKGGELEKPLEGKKADKGEEEGEDEEEEEDVDEDGEGPLTKEEHEREEKMLRWVNDFEVFLKRDDNYVQVLMIKNPYGKAYHEGDLIIERIPLGVQMEMPVWATDDEKKKCLICVELRKLIKGTRGARKKSAVEKLVQYLNKEMRSWPHELDYIEKCTKDESDALKAYKAKPNRTDYKWGMPITMEAVIRTMKALRQFRGKTNEKLEELIEVARKYPPGFFKLDQELIKSQEAIQSLVDKHYSKLSNLRFDHNRMRQKFFATPSWKKLETIIRDSKKPKEEIEEKNKKRVENGEKRIKPFPWMLPKAEDWQWYFSKEESPMFLNKIEGYRDEMLNKFDGFNNFTLKDAILNGISSYEPFYVEEKYLAQMNWIWQRLKKKWIIPYSKKSFQMAKKLNSQTKTLEVLVKFGTQLNLIIRQVQDLVEPDSSDEKDPEKKQFEVHKWAPLYMDLRLFRGLNDAILQLFLRIKQLALSPTEMEPIVMKNKNPEKPIDLGNKHLKTMEAAAVIKNKRTEKPKGFGKKHLKRIEPAAVIKNKSPEKPEDFGNEGLNKINSLIVDMNNGIRIRNKQMEVKEREREEKLKMEKEKMEKERMEKEKRIEREKLEKERIEKEKVEQRLEKLHGHIWIAKRLEALANDYLLRLGLNKANLRKEAKQEEEEMNRRVSMRRKTETLPIIRQFFRRVTRKVTELWREFKKREALHTEALKRIKFLSGQVLRLYHRIDKFIRKKVKRATADVKEYVNVKWEEELANLSCKAESTVPAELSELLMKVL